MIKRVCSVILFTRSVWFQAAVLYRVAAQDWTKEEALKEMVQGGFGFHGIWENLVQWIDGLDIERIKKRAGIR